MAKNAKDNYFEKLTAGFFLFLLVAIVGTALWGFINAIFIALFLFVFLDPLYKLLRRKFGKTPSALISMFVGFFVIVIPVLIVSGLLVQETLSMVGENSLLSQSGFDVGAQMITDGINQLNDFFQDDGVRDLVKGEVIQFAEEGINYFKILILDSIGNVGHWTLGVLVTIFTLYYLLTGERELEGFCKELVPFNKKNTEKLIHEFKRILHAVLICGGFMALLQAIPLTLVLLFYDIPGAIFLGFVGLILSFIPFMGIPFVWIPVVIVELLQGNFGTALGITGVGIIIAILENMRPVFQKNIGRIHPLITIFGIIVGVGYFGFLGVIIGPILLSYLLLVLRMFKEEYT